MVNLVGLTKLIFDGETVIIYMLLSHNFGILFKISSKQSFENKNCYKGLQENTYSSKQT